MERRRIVLSMKPPFAQAILSGRKHIEFRRVRPSLGFGTVAFLYSTSPDKALVGEVVLGQITSASIDELWARFGPCGAVTRMEFDQYFEGSAVGCAIAIESACRWDNPISLDDLRSLAPFHPPQFYRTFDDPRLLKALPESIT